MIIDQAKLELPEELIFFHSKKHHKVLLLNPELGSSEIVPESDLPKLRALDQSSCGLAPSPELIANLIMARVVYYGSHRPRLEDTEPKAPYTVYWETTHGCSLRCTYCYMSADTVKPGELSTKEAESLIDQAAALGVRRIVFTGGEALIRKDIFHLGEYAKARGLETDLITNGTLIRNLSTARRVRDSFHNIVTSLDGGCPRDNDVHRGEGSFDEIVRGIRLLNVVGAYPTVNTVVSSQNVRGLRELFAFLDTEVQVENHRIVYLSRLGRGKEDRESQNWDTYTHIHDAAMERAISGPGPSPGVMTAVTRSGQLRPRKNCGMGSGEIYVDSQGFVYPCKLITQNEWCAGSLRSKGLREILNTDVMKRVRGISVMQLEGCNTCVIRRLCGGG